MSCASSRFHNYRGRLVKKNKRKTPHVEKSSRNGRGDWRRRASQVVRVTHDRVWPGRERSRPKLPGFRQLPFTPSLAHPSAAVPFLPLVSWPSHRTVVKIQSTAGERGNRSEFWAPLAASVNYRTPPLPPS